ncbi:unnamed protein product [Bemisia tabaci]|uniref:Uncharacterized protein n=1 Tax=Bemisia tabaci TaxID=7038 RepID=A0A9P0F8X0_BEMTA|nr:unnamed protein product [Bemisia tabaci]
MEANPVVQNKKPYYGKPSNQKDPKAIAVQPPAKNKKAPKPKPDLPKTLPGPSALSEKPSPMKTSNPADETLFNNGLSVREVSSHTTFTPSLAPAIEIARDSYAEILTDNAQLGKVLLPEYYDYYSTSMLWLRVIHLKLKNGQQITPAEHDLNPDSASSLVLTYQNHCSCTAVLLGNIETVTKSHLYPQFPPLPEQVIGTSGIVIPAKISFP